MAALKTIQPPTSNQKVSRGEWRLDSERSRCPQEFSRSQDFGDLNSQTAASPWISCLFLVFSLQISWWMCRLALGVGMACTLLRRSTVLTRSVDISWPLQIVTNLGNTSYHIWTCVFFWATKIWSFPHFSSVLPISSYISCIVSKKKIVSFITILSLKLIFFFAQKYIRFLRTKEKVILLSLFYLVSRYGTKLVFTVKFARWCCRWITLWVTRKSHTVTRKCLMPLPTTSWIIFVFF